MFSGCENLRAINVSNFDTTNLEDMSFMFHKCKYLTFIDCDDFIDGIHIADQLGQPYERSFKTLVSVGKSGGYFVFVLPIAAELDLKAAARAVGEKSVELLHVKDIKDVTGYIRGGCTAIGMKKKYPTVIDRSCLQFDEIIISGGALGVQLFLPPENFLKAAEAAAAENITEDISHIAEVKTPSSLGSVKCIVTETVILLALFRI